MRRPTLRRRLLLGIAGVLAAAGILGTAPAADASRTDCVPDGAWPATDTSLADQVVALVNQYRAGKGLSQLQISPTLTNAAVWKAREMTADGYFSHYDPPAPPDYPSGRTPPQRLQACGYGADFGENIAANQPTPQAVMTAWLNSPPHKANLDYPYWRAIGVGVAIGGAYEHTWVQDFGTVSDAVQTTSTPTIAAPPATTLPVAATPIATPLGPPAAASGTPAPAPAAATVASPTVRITGRPRVRTRSRRARITWTTSGSVRRVSCSLDGQSLRRCGSVSRTLRSVARGRHVFKVTVSGDAGSASARVRWRVMSG
jgi:uncharacterized protein YkwD